MSLSSNTTERLDQILRETLIRDLVEQYPDAMPVLSRYGIDVCCGGGLSIPAAAEAHSHDVEEVVQHVRAAIDVERSE